MFNNNAEAGMHETAGISGSPWNPYILHKQPFE
jgi:hypothetical protein